MLFICHNKRSCIIVMEIKNVVQIKLAKARNSNNTFDGHLSVGVVTLLVLFSVCF